MKALPTKLSALICAAVTCALVCAQPIAVAAAAADASAPAASGGIPFEVVAILLGTCLGGLLVWSRRSKNKDKPSNKSGR